MCCAASKPSVVEFDPEEVAHLLGVDGEIVGVEWDSSARKVRVVTRDERS